MVGDVTSSAKRSLYPHAVDTVGTQYAVGVSAKSHCTPTQWTKQVLVQKGQLKLCTQQIRVVGAITFSAKRSLYPHTVDTVDL